MKFRISIIFLLTILIPTFFLAYFGLLALRSEKFIIEKNMRQKYRAMANIIENEIQSAVSQIPLDQLFRNQAKPLESLLIQQTALFPDEARILDHQGNLIHGQTALGLPTYVHSIKDFPYHIAVYERYPLIITQLEEKRQRIYMYGVIIIFAAISILGGGIYTLGALAQEWRQARLKSNFVAQLSHDIRKPLTSIRMFSEMLEEGHLPSEEKKREYYKIISEESNKLTDLANSILDFSRIESGRIKYNFQPMDIIEVVHETVDRFKGYVSNERKIHFIKKGVRPLFVQIDVHAISQALMNLLTNADKYSPVVKEIQVCVREQENEVAIEVIDQGVGVPKSEHKKIFKKFYRVAREEGRETEGSGLGLTLVQYTMEAHKGRVEVISEEGRGSKFILTFHKKGA